MGLTKKQCGVLAGMAGGLILSICTFWLAVRFLPLMSRSILLAIVFLGPCAMLFIAIARLAKHRFFSPDDIDGSALVHGTDQARLLQSLLQNTLEQTVLALPVYAFSFYVAPNFLGSMAVGCAILFILGRILFFSTYQHGAAARSFGFAVTFYPTGLLLLAAVIYVFTRAS